ncbi:MAG: monovalent cation/H(+) antiporter subunit G [Gaiellaceae bacterium]|jgi:monovalent cation/proton antiporter MnhG/PhaG subunit
MKTSDILVDVFLTLGVAVQLIACLGVVAFRDVFDRVHYAGTATTVSPLLIGAAVLTRYTTSTGGISTIVVMVLLVVLGPALAIATARAARRIDFGQVEATESERAR